MVSMVIQAPPTQTLSALNTLVRAIIVREVII